MILAKYYYVSYYVVDFSAKDKSTYHEEIYQDYNNALLVAKELIKCLDIVDDVCVIDGVTGEILNTIIQDAPKENKGEKDNTPTDNTEKNNALTPVDTYKDKNGDTWFRISDGRWRFYCVNRYCADCPYYDEECGCIVREALHETDRNYQVDLAHERICAKAKETEKNNAPTDATKKDDALASIDSFEDKNGGIWQLTEDGNWDYDCADLGCSDCVYCNSFSNCDVPYPLREEERNYQIERAKEKICAKANKNSVNNESFEDGFGGVWRKDEDDELWSYDCHGMGCNKCPYNYGRGSCHTSSLSLDDVKKLITETKERIGK